MRLTCKAGLIQQWAVSNYDAEIGRMKARQELYPRESFGMAHLDLAIAITRLKREVTAASPTWLWWALAFWLGWFGDMSEVLDE